MQSSSGLYRTIKQRRIYEEVVGQIGGRIDEDRCCLSVDDHVWVPLL